MRNQKRVRNTGEEKNRKIDESTQSASCEESEESIGTLLNKSENITNLRKLSSNFAMMGLSIIYYLVN